MNCIWLRPLAHKRQAEALLNVDEYEQRSAEKFKAAFLNRFTPEEPRK